MKGKIQHESAITLMKHNINFARSGSPRNASIFLTKKKGYPSQDQTKNQGYLRFVKISSEDQAIQTKKTRLSTSHKQFMQ
jgi:hypothetical protein